VRKSLLIKRFAESFYSKTALQAVLCLILQKNDLQNRFTMQDDFFQIVLSEFMQKICQNIRASDLKICCPKDLHSVLSD